MFYTLKLIPGKVWIFEGEILGILALTAGIIFWVLVPFWAQSRAAERHRLAVAGVGVVLVAYMAVFTALGYWG